MKTNICLKREGSFILKTSKHRDWVWQHGIASKVATRVLISHMGAGVCSGASVSTQLLSNGLGKVLEGDP